MLGAADEDRHEFLMRGDEALKAPLPQVNGLLGLNHAVIAVNEFRDQLERARTLADCGKEECPLGLRRIHRDRLAVDANPEFLPVRHILAPLRILEDVNFHFSNLPVYHLKTSHHPYSLRPTPKRRLVIAAYHKHA